MHISFHGCYYIFLKKKQSLQTLRPSLQHILSLSVSLSLSQSHDIRNYSTLAWTEPARLGVLLPRSWVSDSNRGKLAVTEAGAREPPPCLRDDPLSPGICSLPKPTRGNKSLQLQEMQIRRNTVGVKWAFLHVRMNSHRRNVYTELQRGRCEIECCFAALSHRKLQEWAFLCLCVCVSPGFFHSRLSPSYYQRVTLAVEMDSLAAAKPKGQAFSLLTG